MQLRNKRSLTRVHKKKYLTFLKKSNFTDKLKQKRKLKLYKTKLSSLIISKGCGKSVLKKSLSALSSDLHIVDVGAVIEEVDDKLVNIILWDTAGIYLLQYNIK